MLVASQLLVALHLPQRPGDAQPVSALADHVFDHFHVTPLAGRAVDEVRKELRWVGADVMGGL